MFSVSTKKMPEKKCRMPNIPNTTRFSIDEVYNLYYDKRATGIYQFPIIARSRRNGGLRIMQERALYKTIRDDLLRGIENGSLRPDQALPSERELCQMLWAMQSGTISAHDDGTIGARETATCGALSEMLMHLQTKL